MENEEKGKIPLDAKLLSDAVIELNISRRSVGLYPRDHPIAKDSIERAFQFLEKLFALRHSITLGITGDSLVVDEYALDPSNPVYREFARSLNAKGIAAVTFSTGMTRDELFGLHEMVSMKDAPLGDRFLEELKNKGVHRVAVRLVDFSHFAFVEDTQRKGRSHSAVWEDYVYALMEGKLARDDDAVFLNIPPEDLAALVNSAEPERADTDSYDRVITAYLKKRDGSKLSGETCSRFFSFVENLTPELKRQFMSRSSSLLKNNLGDFESVMRQMSPESFEKIASFFMENATIIPEEMKGLLDRLAALRNDKDWGFDLTADRTAVFDDVEVDGSIAALFRGDSSASRPDPGYRQDIKKMLDTLGTKERSGKINDKFTEWTADRVTMEIYLELLDTDDISAAQYLGVITRLSELTGIFLETGRFEEILDTYNVLNSHVLIGRFRHEASGMIEHFFHSGHFIRKYLESLRLWGRKDREAAARLSRALKRSLIPPLIDSLAEETNSGLRKFFLSMLESIGSDVVPHAVKRLSDARWHVVRNMLYLIRNCHGNREAAVVRKFMKHKNKIICLEALKTLLHFRTPDSIPFLKTFLQADDDRLRTGAIRLAGAYRLKEAVPDLIRLLEKREFFGGETYYKIDVAKALGDIGDRRAIGPLRKIFTSKPLFSKTGMDELKIEILNHVDAFPPDVVQNLAKLGLASKNEKVRAAGEKLLSTPADKRDG